jgi:hypothetical protein
MSNSIKGWADKLVEGVLKESTDYQWRAEAELDHTYGRANRRSFKFLSIVEPDAAGTRAAYGMRHDTALSNPDPQHGWDVYVSADAALLIARSGYPDMWGYVKDKKDSPKLIRSLEQDGFYDEAETARLQKKNDRLAKAEEKGLAEGMKVVWNGELGIIVEFGRTGKLKIRMRSGETITTPATRVKPYDPSKGDSQFKRPGVEARMAREEAAKNFAPGDKVKITKKNLLGDNKVGTAFGKIGGHKDKHGNWQVIFPQGEWGFEGQERYGYIDPKHLTKV